MPKRINVILPGATVRATDRLYPSGTAQPQHYVTTATSEALQERLKQAAICDRDLDLEIASDWSAVDQEQWQRFDTQEKQKAGVGRKEARFTSRPSTRR